MNDSPPPSWYDPPEDDEEPECRHCYNLYAYAPNNVIAKHESQEGCGLMCCHNKHDA